MELLAVELSELNLSLPTPYYWSGVCFYVRLFLF
jgi:hypothetical protein